MADQKISELTNILGADVGAGDEFVVVDSSANETKAITTLELRTAIGNGDFTVTGDLTVQGTTITVDSATAQNIVLGDNDKMTFGAGSDLQIYHDGFNSYIDDVGTGNLNIRGQNIVLRKLNGEAMLVANNDASVDLYFNNSKKLATTSTGIDVTGTVNIDSTSFDPASGWGASQDVSPAGLNFEDNGTTVGSLLGQTYKTDSVSWGTTRLSGFFGMEKTNALGNGDFVWWLAPTNYAQNPAQKMRIASNGDISFYEDTGTTAKFFWDASAESLGIGTSSPSSYNSGSNNLVVGGSSGDNGITIATGTTNGGLLAFADGTTGNAAYRGYIQYDHNTDFLAVGSAGTERMRIDSSGNVGIGVVPDAWSSTGAAIQLQGTGHLATANQYAYIGSNYYYNAGWKYTTSSTAAQYRQDSGSHQWLTAASGTADAALTWSEAMRIDSSGNLLVGRTATGYANTGAQFTASGAENIFVADGNYALGLGRKTSDGDILQFRKDGTTVGSIGTFSGYPIFANNASDGIGIFNNTVAPSTNTGAVNNGNMDLGSSARRFKDLYLSGGLRGDTLKFSNLAGTERMRIDSSGNVGIGTSSPSSALHVKGTSTAVTSTTETTSVYAVNKLKNNAREFDVAIDGSGLYFYDQTAASERMRIDSSGNVGIGTSSPSSYAKLHVDGGSGNNSQLFVTTTDNADVAAVVIAHDEGLQGGLTLSSDKTNGVAKITTNNSSFFPLVFEVRGSDGTNERMRIDSSGNLLVGTTDASQAANTSGNGTVIGANGGLEVSRDSFSVAYFNKTSVADGTVVEIRKQGINRGNIGYVGQLVIHNSDMGIGFSNDDIRPVNGSGANTDNSYDLGHSSVRWKDLYLSGGVYLGGTGAANKLDDYEEGTFTPTVNNGTVSVSTGSYVKIGNLVTVTLVLGNFSDATSGTLTCNNMPFTSKSGDAYQAHGAVMHQEFNIASAQGITAFMNDGTASLVWYANQGSTGWTAVRNSHIDTATQAYLRTTITYRTT